MKWDNLYILSSSKFLWPGYYSIRLHLSLPYFIPTIFIFEHIQYSPHCQQKGEKTGKHLSPLKSFFSQSDTIFLSSLYAQWFSSNLKYMCTSLRELITSVSMYYNDCFYLSHLLDYCFSKFRTVPLVFAYTWYPIITDMIWIICF